MQQGSGEPRNAPSISTSSISLITDCGEGHSSCGYCKSTADTSCSYGMQAEFLTVDAYQQLLDRGWRRSGRWIYRPVHKETCCQLLTIRLDVRKFSPNKDQKKVQRKWDAYLAGHVNIKHPDEASLQGSSPKRPRDESDDDGNDDDIVRAMMIDMAVKKRDASAHAVSGKFNMAGNDNDNDGGDNTKKYAHSITGSSSSMLGGGKRQRSMADLQEYETLGVLNAPSYVLDSSMDTFHEDPMMAINQDMSSYKRELETEEDTSSPTAALTHRLQSTLGSPLTHRLQSTLGSPMKHASLLHSTTPTTEVNNGHEYSSASGEDDVHHHERKSKLQECILYAMQQCFRSNEHEITLVSRAYGTVSAIPVLSVQEKQQKKLMTSRQHEGVIQYSSPVAMVLAGRLNKVQRQMLHIEEDGFGKKSTVEQTMVSPQDIAEKLVLAIKSAAASGTMPLPSAAIDVIALSGHLNFITLASNSKKHQTQDDRTKRTAVQQHYIYQGTPIPRSVPRHFELTMRPSSDPSLPSLEFDLYKRYQVVHHGDAPSAVSISSFRRFLCDSPLIPSSSPSEVYPSQGVPSCGFGSFHQQYFVDGRLVAVGVVDVLPKCLSSKYLFWDPDLAPLSLGKVTSLQEIEWIKEANQSCSTLKYYYLGYYIHTCHRMKYKADFAPSDLLCPVNQCWVPIDRVIELLESGVKEPALSNIPGALVHSSQCGGHSDGDDCHSSGDDDDESKDGRDEDTAPQAGGATTIMSEYCVTPDGRPAHPPRQPTVDEVGEVLLFLSMPGSSGTSSIGRTGRGGRRGQIVSFRTLCTLGVLREGGAERISHRLEKWMYVVGPAWRRLVYCIN